MANLTTLDRALQWIGQGSDPQDLVSRLISATSQQVETFLGYAVLQASHTRTFNGEDLRLLFVPDVPLVSVQSLTINGNTIPQGSVVGGTQQAGFYNDAVSIALIGYAFRRGFQNITATYTAGRTTVPADMEQAVLDWMKISWSNQSQIGIGNNVTSIASGDVKIEFGGDGNVTDVNVVPMPSSVYAVLSLYQRNTGF
jgi:hypothetical protein